MSGTTIEAIAAIRAEYGPRELEALRTYGDVAAALEAAGLPTYVETRGGLALCSMAPDGSLLVVASEEALPSDRSRLSGWHLSHCPEDGPAARWRCIVHDTVPTTSPAGACGDLALEPLIAAAQAHLAACRRHEAA
ncbi:hypothetical protein ACH4UT_10360 [Streptomyces sp. NPDC020799]|uniref:hypothetical protein n=1 Tax=Streptomyces sp. NPDC020799 TaxID=3365091 RepID=UPI0037B39531